MLNLFRWLSTPGCGLAALLLMYDAWRAIRPRITGERLWRETRALGLLTLLIGAFGIRHLEDMAWIDGVTNFILILALGPLLLSSVTLKRLVAEAVRRPMD